MAYLPIPQPCKNNCGTMIYFDKTSAVGHPEADKWIPLVYEKDTGAYTEEPHKCPNRSQSAKSRSDLSSNQHKTNLLEKPSEESVDRGITAFSMMSSLIVLVEQTQKQLVTMDEKLSRLLNLAELSKK